MTLQDWRQRLGAIGQRVTAWWTTRSHRTRVVLAAGAALALLGACLGLLTYSIMGRDLPDYRALAAYEPPLGTTVLAADGTPIITFSRERRIYVPLADMPAQLRQAFLSAEDKSFYTHEGLDYPGIFRAILTNWRNRGTDKRPVGASTITQQLAKNLLLTSEVKLTRKIREAILARRIETMLSKDRILELYLNQIFLGENSYGVGAAALTYFNKTVDQLTLAEISYLAALPKGPNNYHPKRRKPQAIARRNWVLEQMHANGYISTQQRAAAQASDLVVAAPQPQLQGQKADYYLEEVRREILRKFGDKGLYSDGLWVRTNLDLNLQDRAEEVFRDGLVRFDRSRNWRGPAGSITLEGDWAKRLRALDVPVGYAYWKAAVILARGPGGFALGFGDGGRGVLPAGAANQWQQRGTGVPAGSLLKRGDVIVVAANAPGSRLYNLRQIPEISGGMVVENPHTGGILAMVGGFDARKSEFNRATQAKRQPGSAFKPFVYAAAMENGFTPSSIVVDAEFCINQGNKLGMKCFRNFGGRLYGPTTLRTGLEQSRNLMTVRVANRIGMDKVVGMGKATGIYDRLSPVLAMALGAGETTVLRLVNAYAILDNHGVTVAPSLIESVQDRHGKVIFRRDQRTCVSCNGAWMGAPPPDPPAKIEQAVDPVTAYQVIHLMEGVVERGTAQSIKYLDRPLAGKTGTTNDSTNVWFVGLTPDMVAGVYLGFDTPRSLGGWAQGGNTAAPIIGKFFEQALKDAPKIPFRMPPGVRLVRVDRKSGRLARGAEGPTIIYEAYKPGTEPQRYAGLGEEREIVHSDADFVSQTGGIY